MAQVRPGACVDDAVLARGFWMFSQRWLGAVMCPLPGLLHRLSFQAVRSRVSKSQHNILDWDVRCRSTLTELALRLMSGACLKVARRVTTSEIHNRNIPEADLSVLLIDDVSSATHYVGYRMHCVKRFIV